MCICHDNEAGKPSAEPTNIYKISKKDYIKERRPLEAVMLYMYVVPGSGSFTLKELFDSTVNESLMEGSPTVRTAELCSRPPGVTHCSRTVVQL